MMMVSAELVLLCACALLSAPAQALNTNETEAQEYMDLLNEVLTDVYHRKTIAGWNYSTNITDYNSELLAVVEAEAAALEKEYLNQTLSYDWESFEDEELKRLFERFSTPGYPLLSAEKNSLVLGAIQNMTANYATATICAYNDTTSCDLTLNDVSEIFSTSRDPEELKDAWEQWHHAAGVVSKGNFTEYVELANEAAELNGCNSRAEYWLLDYAADDFDAEESFLELWLTVRPLYLQLHAYVRSQLRLQYGEDVVSAKGPIPAHLLGDVWAQTWTNINDISTPFPNKTTTDVTDALVAQNYTALKMFQTADEFFQSINLTAMPDLFYENSLIVDPDDGRDLDCHPSSWDFFDKEDFRIKQCTLITNDFFMTTHHEMGHIENFIQYKEQPLWFKAGANPGFSEAVGDAISLSVSSTKHLNLIGLLDNATIDNETEINQLYYTALDKVAFLPFGYMLDLFRYSVFRGNTTEDYYNCHFWAFREALQGVEPPVNRTEDDFDAAAKYHVSADVEYMRYYLSYIILFQFHQAMCELAGEYGSNSTQTLSNCDIYGSSAAGNALGEMLALGVSKPWPDAMELLTGQRTMNSSSVLEYFQPLQEWLEEQNESSGEYIGWEASSVQYCTDAQLENMEESGFTESLTQYNPSTTECST